MGFLSAGSPADTLVLDFHGKPLRYGSVILRQFGLLHNSCDQLSSPNDLGVLLIFMKYYFFGAVITVSYQDISRF